MNAEIGPTIAAEVITLEFAGEVDQHADSVLLPLLLSELPVVIWSRDLVPGDPARCDLSALAHRKIVDSMTTDDPMATVYELARSHQPGTTDLSWTRLTRWRALLVAALNQVRSTVTSAEVVGPLSSAPSELSQRGEDAPQVPVLRPDAVVAIPACTWSNWSPRQAMSSCSGSPRSGVAFAAQPARPASGAGPAHRAAVAFRGAFPIEAETRPFDH